MADTKISALTATTTLEDTDLATVVTGIGATPTNKAITVANLRTEMQDGITVPSDISDLTDSTGIIPTNTSDLTNGAGFITAGDIPAIPADLSDLTDTTSLLVADVSELTDTTGVIPTDVSDLADTTGVTLPTYAGASEGDVLTIDTGVPVWSAPAGGSADATSLQGFGITETDPSDGKILVYRTASNAYVLEDKPAAGANPAAADVSNTPAGDIAATDVQGALNELDTEKVSKILAIAYAVAF